MAGFLLPLLLSFGAHKYDESQKKKQDDEIRQKVLGILGNPEQTQPQQGPMMPGQQPQQIPIKGSGTGLLGGQLSMPQAAAKMMAIPGYENIGGQLLLGAQQNDFALQKAKFDALAQKQDSAFDDTAKLRGEFTNQSKDFIKIRDAYGRIIAAADKPTAAGDLALIFNYMKMLDPGSTVREGEFANAQNSAGVPDVIRSWYNRIRSGERLAETQRADFMSRSSKLYESQLKGHAALENQYTGIAHAFNLNPKNVIPDYRVNYGKLPNTSLSQEIPPPPGKWKKVN